MRSRFPKTLALFVLPLALLAQQSVPVAKAVPPSSWKALKFPALRDIQIPKVEESTLPNGMKVYLLENHELPLVRGTALVRTGNLFDPSDKIGLATITGETIRAGGTATKSGDQIDEQLENIAASVESSIGESSGRVAFSTLKERTDEVLGVFRDVLTAPGFRDDKIELAKSQLRNGISRRNDDAQGISQREFADLIYGRNTPFGWQEQYATVDSIKRTDVENFYKRYFFPANVILAVSGDFNSAEMKGKIEQLFSGWNYQQPPVPAFPKVDNQPKAGVYLATKGDVTQTNFSMGQLGGVLNDKDFPALEVMSYILGGGFESRLFRRVRTQLGYAYEIGSSWGADYDHPGLFQIYGSTKSASTADTLKAVGKEVQRIRSEEVTAEELESARQVVINGFVFNFDTPSKTLNRLLTYRYYGYPDDFIFQYLKAVSSVSRADILRVAKQYLDPAKFVIVATGNPKEFGTPLSSLDLPLSDIDLTIPEPKAAVSATSPESIAKGKATLGKALAAMGGPVKLAAVKDMTENATLKIDRGGLTATQVEQWLASGQMRQEVVLPFGKIVTYSDGKTGWAVTPQGAGPLPDAQLKQFTGELFRMWFPLMLSGQSEDRVVTESPDGKLEISDKAGHSVILTLDPQTALPATMTYGTAGTPEGIVEETFTGWQEADGVKLPRSVSINQSGAHFADAVITAIKLNQGLTTEQLSKKP